MTEKTEIKGLYRAKGTPWVKIGCLACGEIHSGYNLFLHDDYPNGVLVVCKNCDEIYFLKSDIEGIVAKE